MPLPQDLEVLTLITLAHSSDYLVYVYLGVGDSLDARCSHRVLFLVTASQRKLTPHTPACPLAELYLWDLEVCLRRKINSRVSEL